MTLKLVTDKAEPLFRGIPQTDETIIAAGPLTKQPSTVAYRLVLRYNEFGEFIVHNQFFRKWPSLDTWDFADGNYFKSGELTEATAKFAERLAKGACFLNSIYRAG